MTDPTLPTLSPQITPHPKKKQIPRERLDRREKSGPTRLTTWPRTRKACTCSTSSSCSSQVFHFSLRSFAFAFLYTTSFKLRKLLQEKKALNSLTKEAKEKNGEHMPTLETSDEIKVKELRAIYNDNDTFLDLIIIKYLMFSINPDKILDNQENKAF